MTHERSWRHRQGRFCYPTPELGAAEQFAPLAHRRRRQPDLPRVAGLEGQQAERVGVVAVALDPAVELSLGGDLAGGGQAGLEAGLGEFVGQPAPAEPALGHDRRVGRPPGEFASQGLAIRVFEASSPGDVLVLVGGGGFAGLAMDVHTDACYLCRCFHGLSPVPAMLFGQRTTSEGGQPFMRLRIPTPHAGWAGGPRLTSDLAVVHPEVV